MPRARVWPPRIYPHVSGRDRIRVNGIDYWLGLSGSDESKKEYARLVAELAELGTATSPRAKAALTLAGLVERWAAERMPSCSRQEASQFRRALTVLIAGGRARLPVDRFKVGQLREVRTAMIALGWCRNVVNRQIVRLRTVWRWAEEAGYAPEGSWNHLRTLRALPGHDRSARQTPRTRPADLAELELILPRIGSRAVRAMLLLQRHSGMRSGEVRGMRAGEVDQSGEVWIYRPAKHKMSWKGQDRAILLGPEAQAVLRPWLARKKDQARVFLNREGRPYTANAYGLCASRAAKKVGLPWFRPYCLRHGAKQRITRELGLDAARAVLGQKHLGTTNEYGDALDLDTARRAVTRLG